MTTPTPPDFVRDLKDALSAWASGVCVVTTNADGLLYGITVSSFSSVSLEPPLVLVCLNKSNRLPGMIDAASRFAVSLLASDQEAAARYFARPGRLPTPDFVEVDGEWTGLGVPVVKDALAHLVCDVHHAVEAGDHLVVIGRVIEAVSRPDKMPLLYFRRGYRHEVG